MKLSSAIKRATKATGVQPTIIGGRFSFDYNGKVLDILQNGRIESDSVALIVTKRKGQVEDSMTDYFPGVYHNSLKKALEHIGAI